MKKLVLVLSLALVSLSSNAAVLIEPVLGYNFANFELKDNNSGQKTDGKGRGASYGGRLGYHNLGFSLGVDYLSSNIDVDDSNIKADLKTSEFAGFIGYRLPILLKVYAGYIFSGSAETELGPSNSKSKFEKGTGPKVGIGWTAFPFLDFNLEYRKVTWDDHKSGGTTQKTDQSYSSVLLSVSVPITF